MAAASGVFYNNSGSLPCFSFAAEAELAAAAGDDGNFWWYQACTEMVMPFSSDGGKTWHP
jgi:hypothetical protein